MIKKGFVISAISLLLMSAFVLVAGSSTANAQNNANNVCETNSDCILRPSYGCCGDLKVCQNVNEQAPTEQGCSPLLGCPVRDGPTSCGCVNSVCVGSYSINNNVKTCEDKSTLKERIKCRLENKEVAREEKSRSVEEACRSDSNATKMACERLYNVSARCYEQADAITKKKCFLQESGVNINKGGTFRATPDESKRNYVVLLLYDLQERIENMHENGNISSEQASSLIQKIVDIKRMILAKEKRSEIVLKMQEFKKEYREIVKPKREQQ